MQHPFACDGDAVFLRRVPVRGFGECLQHAPLEAVVRRFELLRQDGLAFGSYGVAQYDAGCRFVVVPFDLPGDVLVEGRAGLEDRGFVVAERDEYYPVGGFLPVAGDGFLVGRQGFDIFDVVGRDRFDLFGFDAVDDLQWTLRHGGERRGVVCG